VSGHDWSERFWSPTSSQGIYEPKTAFIFGHDQDGAHIVSRKVRQWDHAPYVYLILLTSKDQHEDIIAGLEAEAGDYLIKPLIHKSWKPVCALVNAFLTCKLHC
jgi:PleD family two-component response regulator